MGMHEVINEMVNVKRMMLILFVFILSRLFQYKDIEIMMGIRRAS